MTKSILVSTLILLCAVILESSILSNISFIYIVPDLVLICSLYFSLLNGKVVGESTGFISGIILDFITGIPFGFNCILRTIIGYVAGIFAKNVIISGFKDSIGLYETPTVFQKATARAWLKLAGFEGRESENFSSLSYGEQRAILILRAAVKSPEVLILDEPCHGLDDNYRTKLLDLIQTVAATGTTTLLHVTHDPSEVLECEKHILELLPGHSPMFKIIEN